jgi:hypothetical protein
MRTHSKNRSYANINRIHTINKIDAKIDCPHSPERELYDYVSEANEIRPKSICKLLGIEKNESRAETIRRRKQAKGYLNTPLRIAL